MTTIFDIGTDKQSPLMAGDYLRLDVSVVDGDGVAIDLTGILGATYEIVEDQPGGADSKVAKSLGSGITVTDAGNGAVQIVVASGDTDGLDGRYLHAFKYTDSANRLSTAFIGQAVIAKQPLA